MAPWLQHRTLLLRLLVCISCFALGVMVAMNVNVTWQQPEIHTISHASRSSHLVDAPRPILFQKPDEADVMIDGSTHAAYVLSNQSNSTRAVGDFHPNERGIIMCLHNGIVSMGVSLIRELRCLGNTEVIQVYHCFNELTPESQALLQRNDSNVEIIDVCQRLMDADNGSFFHQDESFAKGFQSYWIKPLALYYTRLQEVILLDADAILMRDPADLRRLSGYESTGTIFFYDRIVALNGFFNKQVDSGSTVLHKIIETFDYAQFGLDGPQPSAQLQQSFAYRRETAHEQDSSMVFINKAKAGKAMEILKHLFMKLRFEYNFSWGDKEAFWLSYELAHQPYLFSPWGLSLVDSVPNDDLKDHPDSLCGSMAHFVPTEKADEPPELLYVNGKALLDPFPVGSVKKTIESKPSRMYNLHPTHVTPRYNRTEFDLSTRETFECMDHLGSVALPSYFYERLLRRRLHFLAVETQYYHALDQCHV